jgi:hypothetical protein
MLKVGNAKKAVEMGIADDCYFNDKELGNDKELEL